MFLVIYAIFSLFYDDRHIKKKKGKKIFFFNFDHHSLLGKVVNIIFLVVKIKLFKGASTGGAGWIPGLIYLGI